MTHVATVAGLSRYPVKSLQGESLDHVTLRHDGVEGDRRFAFRDLDTGQIASAKQPRPWRDLLDLTARGVGDEVVVQDPDGEEYDLHDPALLERLHDHTGRCVEVVAASHHDLGSYDSEWPEVAGVTLAGQRRFQMALSTEAVRFVDVASLHLVTTATLARLEAAHPGSVADPRRFRPNLVLDTGATPPSFLEDAWVGRGLRIGARCEIRVTTRTPRCVMTTVAQPGLDHDPGVLRAAATNRHDFGALGTMACAGAYAEVITPGSISTGDVVALR